jgi:hypothetical protein
MQINKIVTAGAIVGSLALTGVAFAATHPSPNSAPPTQASAVQAETSGKNDVPDSVEAKNAVDTDGAQENVQQDQSGPDNKTSAVQDGESATN